MNKYHNLRGKTIYDFCDDAKMLDSIAVVDKGDYLAEIKQNPMIAVWGLLTLAEKTNNEDLRLAVEKEFQKEIRAQNNE